MASYTPGFRERMVSRLSGPDAISARALAAEVNIPAPTLSRWLRDAAKVGNMSKTPETPKSSGRPPGRPRKDRSAEEKYRLVMASAAIDDAGLGEFLRREGLHDEDLQRYRDEVRNAALQGLSGTAASRASLPGEQARIKELERELRRKEAALAETAALLVLRKKAVALWGEEGGDT